MENIGVDDKFEIKFLDYGGFTKYDEESYGALFIWYPRKLQGLVKSSEKDDIWSLSLATMMIEG